MKELMAGTSLLRAIGREREETFSQSVLAVFPDGKYLRSYLKECAKAFFRAAEGTRAAELIDKEIFSDCLIYPPEGKKLTVELCGQITEESLLMPVEEKKKLIVLDAFHLAPALVQNKLLKLLEEPPANVSFLLGAETEYPVLPTVLSRVKKFSLPAFSEEEIEDALRRKYPLREGIREAAAASGGLFSVAESLLEDGGREFGLAEEFLTLRDPELFCRKNAEADKRDFFAALKAVLRDVLFLSAGQGRYAKLGRPGTEALAADYPTGAALRALELVFEAEKQIQFNANFASCLYSLALGVKEEKEKWKKLS